MTTLSSTDLLNRSKSELKQRTKKALHIRINKIEEVINSIIHSHNVRLEIDQSLKQQICNQVSDTIDKYEGSKKLKNNIENSLKAVQKNARTWWNRAKSKELGSVLFTVLFYVIHHFIKQQCSNYSIQQQMILFIDIFIALMEANVKFPKTKPKPLILHQCFIAQSEFSSICSEFVKTFGDKNISVDLNVKKVVCKVSNGKRKYEYDPNKNRSVNVFNQFKQCLIQIKTKISDPFANESIVMWLDIIQKFPPKSYQLSFRSISSVNYNNNIKHIIVCAHGNGITPQVTHNNCNGNHCHVQLNNMYSNTNNYYSDQISPSTEYETVSAYATNNIYNQHTENTVFYDNTPHINNNNNVRNCHCNNCDNIPQMGIISQNNIQLNSNNYYHSQISPSTEYEYNDIQQGHLQYQTTCNQRQFQSTNHFGTPLNRIHRTNYTYGNQNKNIMRNSAAEIRTERREEHIEKLINKRFSCDNSQYLSNDSNTVSDGFSLFSNPLYSDDNLINMNNFNGDQWFDKSVMNPFENDII